jgi:putative membrane protein
MESERGLHPLSVLFAIGDTAKQFLIPALVAIFATRSRDAWEVWGVVVLVPLALIAFVRVLSFRYRFEATELVIRWGFVFKRMRHIPYDRIQNVDAVQNVLHRVFNVIEVRVETGGGAETEAALTVENRAAFYDGRRMVFAWRSGVVEAAQAPAAPDVILAMPPRAVFLFGLLHGRGMIVAGALFGLLFEFGILDRMGGTIFGENVGRGVIRRLARGIFDDVTVPFEQYLLGIGAVVFAIAVFRLASALWNFVTYYGFRLTRSGDDLRCEYGLLTRVTSTIPVRRIQKVIVRAGPWHRLGHRLSVGVQTAGGKAEQAGGSTRSWLAPLVRRERLASLLAGIVPDAAVPVDWQPVHPRGVRREFVGSLFVLVPLSVALSFYLGRSAIVPIALLFIWSYYNARRTVAALGWGVSDETVQFRSGWIWRSRLVAPLTKVQAVSRRQTPFDRRHRMATVFADTAGRSQGDYAIRIPYLPAPVAASLSDHLSAAAARTSFHW